MKLSDLAVWFIGNVEDDGSFHRQLVAEGAQGIVFLCPRCATEAAAGNDVGIHSIVLFFENPRNAPAVSSPLPKWHFEGTALSNVTLTPSVHVKLPCGWHGWITDGTALTC